MQKLFAENRPDEVLKTTVEAQPANREIFALAGLDHKSREVILKVVNRSSGARQVSVRPTGLDQAGSKARLTILAHQDSTAENTLDDPAVVLPVASEISKAAETFTLSLPPFPDDRAPFMRSRRYDPMVSVRLHGHRCRLLDGAAGVTARRRPCSSTSAPAGCET